jgi:hypothetical protein
MTTLFAICFIAGLGLSVVSYASGMHHVAIFHGLFHGHRVLHLPKVVRHGSHRTSMINAAAITAFLTWFGGSGLLLERLTHWSFALIVAVAGAIGAGAAALINSTIGALARRESTAIPLAMIGVIGRTTVSIRGGDGTGEIVFTHAGTRRVAAARSDSGRAIPKGTEVVVTRYSKGIAWVALWDELKEE